MKKLIGKRKRKRNPQGGRGKKPWRWSGKQTEGIRGKRDTTATVDNSIKIVLHQFYRKTFGDWRREIILA